jgi:hypothetical protein
MADWFGRSPSVSLPAVTTKYVFNLLANLERITVIEVFQLQSVLANHVFCSVKKIVGL